jgi:NAD(P)-dependent dehydrogenase (short-subunit alcohol dehydrogenase family)
MTRTVLITGCSSGIGHATALRLAARGWLVYATARRLDTLSSLAAAGCRTLSLDVTDETSMRAAVERAQSEQGGLDALVNNAGYSQSGALETVPIERVRQQFETNVFGPLRLCQLVLPGMRARRSGRIVNLSSMGGRLTFPGGGAYHASKYAVEALSDVLRFEVARFGIQVVVIEPGLIRSTFSATAAAGVESVPGSAYQRFDRAVVEATERVYTHGLLARLGGPPEAVARVIELALTATRPRSRYRVTSSAQALIMTRRLLPDRAWDTLMRSQFPQPGPG